jgi:hypothetical protein
MACQEPAEKYTHSQVDPSVASAVAGHPKRSPVVDGQVLRLDRDLAFARSHGLTCDRVLRGLGCVLECVHRGVSYPFLQDHHRVVVFGAGG